MKKFHHLVIKIVCLSIFVSIQCKKVVDPVLDIIPDKVEIEDVWFSDMLDYDGDGYCSDGKLFFELSSNKITGVQSFVWLGYKRSVYVDSSTYYKCFVSNRYVTFEMF